MKIKLTNMLKGKERMKEQICRVKQGQIKKGVVKINCKGKRTVGKANKRIDIEEIIIGLKY